MIRLAGLDDLDTLDTDGIAYAVYFQGCSRKCRGCHNPELQNRNGGEMVNVDDIVSTIYPKRDYYDYVVIMGGEPLEQPDGLLKLLRGIRAIGLKTWLYTSYELYQIPQDILDQCNVVKTGAYIEDLKTHKAIDYKNLASKNQQLHYINGGKRK